MTDKPNSYVLGKGRLHFEPVRRYPADALTLRNYQMSGKLAEGFYEKWLDANFILRVISITGYNPQMLLPAPSFEDEFMQSMTEWAAEQMKLPYVEFAKSVLGDSVIGDGFIDFERNSDVPVKSHADWSETELRVMTSMMREDAEVLLIGDTAYEMLASIRKTMELAERWKQASDNTQIATYIYGMFIHESAGGSPVPRGKIELFDYDHPLEQIGRAREEIYARTGIRDVLRQKPEFVPIRGKQPSYLDHDPTKRHKRRKKK